MAGAGKTCLSAKDEIVTPYISNPDECDDEGPGGLVMVLKVKVKVLVMEVLSDEGPGGLLKVLVMNQQSIKIS